MVSRRVLSRQESAQERQDERDSRTAAQQLARLDQLLGKGVGAVKERARLQRMLNPAPVASEEAPAAEGKRRNPKGKAKKQSEESA